MTYALVQISELVAVALALRSTLKCLKGLSFSSSQKGALGNGRAADQLIFWVVFAVLSMYEKHLEFILRWIPGYYYVKFFYVVSITFPQLRITNLVFWDFWVVLINRVNKYLIEDSSKTLYETALDAPFFLLLLVFPAIGNVHMERRNDDITLQEQNHDDDLVLSSHISCHPNQDCNVSTTVSDVNTQRIKVVSYKTGKCEQKKTTVDSGLGSEIPFQTSKNQGATIAVLCGTPEKTNIEGEYPDPHKKNDIDVNLSASAPLNDSASMGIITTPIMSNGSNLMSSVSPRSMKECKQDTLRRLSSLTPVVRRLHPRTRSISPNPIRKPHVDSPLQCIKKGNRITKSTFNRRSTYPVSDDVETEYEEMNLPDLDISGKNVTPILSTKSGSLSLAYTSSDEKIKASLRSRRYIIEKERMRQNSTNTIFDSTSEKNGTDSSYSADSKRKKDDDKKTKSISTLSKAKILRTVTSLFDLDLTHRPLNSAARNRRRDTLGMDKK